MIAQPESKATFYHVTWVAWSYPVLAPLSRGYPELKQRLPMYYSPVRRFTHPRRDFHARLACVRHATSVRSEPGSNSQIILKLNWTFRTKNRGLTILLSKSRKTSEKDSNTLLHALSNSALAATQACRRVCLIAFLKELSKLPLNEYKYSYFFIFVKRFILSLRK